MMKKIKKYLRNFGMEQSTRMNLSMAVLIIAFAPFGFLNIISSLLFLGICIITIVLLIANMTLVVYNSYLDVKDMKQQQVLDKLKLNL